MRRRRPRRDAAAESKLMPPGVDAPCSCLRNRQPRSTAPAARHKPTARHTPTSGTRPLGPVLSAAPPLPRAAEGTLGKPLGRRADGQDGRVHCVLPGYTADPKLLQEEGEGVGTLS